MIVRMARVAVLGPKGLLVAVLDALRELDAVQVERNGGLPPELHPLPADAGTALVRLRLETLHERLTALLGLLPELSTRQAYLDPPAALPALERVTQHQLLLCRERYEELQRLQRQAGELTRQLGILETMQALLAGLELPADSLLDVLGVTLREASLAEVLAREAEALTGGRCALAVATAPDGTSVAVLAAGRDSIGVLRSQLQQERIAELDLPAELRDQPLPRQLARLQAHYAALQHQLAQAEAARTAFARRWLPFYRRTLTWVEDRLALLAVTAEITESAFCFFINGWMPQQRVAEARALLETRFNGQVLLQEQELHEADLELAPVTLRNPAYFRPFELLLRLLPLPRYTSCDPTPLLGLFFPLFFGLMLGDIAYGAILVLVAGVLLYRVRQPGLLHDIAGILLPCAISATLFGVLFGECFGEAGARYLGLTPLLFSRGTEITTLLWFCLSIGVAHVLLGLGLGIRGAFASGARHEAWQRLLQLGVVVLLVLAVAAALAPSPWLPLRPALLALGVSASVLLLTGGLLAPLETLKTIGNIVSYARLMAIGLTSVLLAHVANALGGMSANVVAGILVAGVLHAFNLVLGVFAPTVHALRLHYVEFFSKFLEAGGRRFQPLGKHRPKEV